MIIARISTEIFELKRGFSKKAEMESKNSPFFNDRHYIHDDKEVLVLRIVKIG